MMFTTKNRYTIRVSNPNVIKRFNEDGRKYYEMDARVNFNDLVADLPNDPNIRSNEILGKQLNKKGVFDPIKQALKGHPAENWIRFNETDPKQHEHTVLNSFATVRHAISLLKLFDITSPPKTTKHQELTEAYTNMAGHVEEFASKTELGEIYSSLVPQMLEMEEYIRVRGGELWNDFVKETAKPKDKEFKANSFTNKPKKEVNNKTYPLTGLPVGYQSVLSKALTVPLLAAFRNFV